MSAQSFRPKFTTSAREAEERADEAYELPVTKNSMRGARSVEGTSAPSNARVVPVGSVGDSKDITGAIKPIPRGHAFTPALSDRQQRMIK